MPPAGPGAPFFFVRENPGSPGPLCSRGAGFLRRAPSGRLTLPAYNRGNERSGDGHREQAQRRDRLGGSQDRQAGGEEEGERGRSGDGGRLAAAEQAGDSRRARRPRRRVDVLAEARRRRRGRRLLTFRESFFRRSTRELVPYEPGKPVEEVQRELGLERVVKLASNEGPYGPFPQALEALERASRELNRYPDGGAYRLRAALAGRHGVQFEEIAMGAGADGLIDGISQAVLDPGDE